MPRLRTGLSSLGETVTDVTDPRPLRVSVSVRLTLHLANCGCEFLNGKKLFLLGKKWRGHLPKAQFIFLMPLSAFWTISKSTRRRGGDRGGGGKLHTLVRKIRGTYNSALAVPQLRVGGGGISCRLRTRLSPAPTERLERGYFFLNKT